MRRFATVDEYLAAQPAPQRAALRKLRAQIRAAAPEATEKIAYGIPTFVHDGNLVHFAAFPQHCSFYPGRAGVAMLREARAKGFTTAKGTIRFTPERPLPAALVREIVRTRVRENEARRGRTPAAKAARRPARAAGKRRAEAAPRARTAKARR